MWALGGLTVNRIGFGAKRLPGSTALDLGNASGRDRVIGAAAPGDGAGVNHIDTAAFYPTYAQDRPIHDFTPLNWANGMIHWALVLAYLRKGETFASWPPGSASARHRLALCYRDRGAAGRPRPPGWLSCLSGECRG